VRGGRLGDEVTSQTQAIQSIANNIKTPNRVLTPKNTCVFFSTPVLQLMIRGCEFGFRVKG